MDVNKRKIIKSKSSNSALVQKVERRDRKSKSNGQFEPQIVKKRGVYVQNKPVNMSLSAQGQNIKEKKPGPPPRAGRKRFLASVLTILSKSSAGTQYPDKNDPRPKLKKKMKDAKKKSSPTKTEELPEIRQKSPDRIKVKVEPEKKRQKYRSKVLNNDRDYMDKLKVIKRTKEFHFTPHDSSSKEDIKWSDFPNLKDNDEEHTSIVNNIVKEVSEGQQQTDIQKIDKDPSTLVADAHKNDKRLYNFFVDLLETTFTLYDVKDTRDKTIRSVSSSKVAFEIDEQVAQKLKVKKPPMFDDVTQKPSRHYHNIKSDHHWNDDKLIDYFTYEPTFPMSPRERSKSPVKRKKLKSNSFPHPKYRQPKISSLSTQSAVLQQNVSRKRPKKRDLLNILKEELSKEPYVHDEPQNLFDALKVMARNKRKCQKTLRFTNVKKNTADLHDDECMLKRRKIMRPSSSFRYNKRLNQKPSEVMKVSKSKVAETPERVTESSVHSIEVYGFEYNHLPKKLGSCRRRKKELSLPYHSSTSECEDCDF